MFTFGISSYLFNNCRFTYKAINVCIITHLSSDGNQFSYQFSAKLFLLHSGHFLSCILHTQVKTISAAQICNWAKYPLMKAHHRGLNWFFEEKQGEVSVTSRAFYQINKQNIVTYKAV